jgi:hypothetical protein
VRLLFSLFLPAFLGRLYRFFAFPLVDLRRLDIHGLGADSGFKEMVPFMPFVAYSDGCFLLCLFSCFFQLSDSFVHICLGDLVG